jgi:hypothetical protein
MALLKNDLTPSSPFVKRGRLSPPFNKGRWGGILEGDLKQSIGTGNLIFSR